MKIELKRDVGLGAWTFTNERVAVQSYADLVQLRHLVRDALQRVERQSLFLVGLDGFILAPELREAYGLLAKEFIGTYARAVFRYGGGLTATTNMRIAATKANLAPQIFDTRDAAVHALRQLRAGDTRRSKTAATARASDEMGIASA